MSFPAAGGSNRYGTNHCHRTHLTRQRRQGPGTGPHSTTTRTKAWVFDFEPGKTGERYKLEEARAAEVLLLGRVTYETMGAFWPGFDGPFADNLNAMPKYVLSTTLERADWTDSTILRGDLVTEVTRMA
jgi:dihydrofolate reductase